MYIGSIWGCFKKMRRETISGHRMDLKIHFPRERGVPLKTLKTLKTAHLLNDISRSCFKRPFKVPLSF